MCWLCIGPPGPEMAACHPYREAHGRGCDKEQHSVKREPEPFSLPNKERERLDASEAELAPKCLEGGIPLAPKQVLDDKAHHSDAQRCEHFQVPTCAHTPVMHNAERSYARPLVSSKTRADLPALAAVTG